MVDENESWEDCAYRVFTNPMTNPCHIGEIKKSTSSHIQRVYQNGIIKLYHNLGIIFVSSKDTGPSWWVHIKIT